MPHCFVEDHLLDTVWWRSNASMHMQSGAEEEDTDGAAAEGAASATQRLTPAGTETAMEGAEAGQEGASRSGKEKREIVDER